MIVSMGTDSAILESGISARRAALQRAIEVAKGQARLAKTIGTSQSQVSFWLNEAKKGVPPEYCAPIEENTGVPRHELRPDVFSNPQTARSSS